MEQVDTRLPITGVECRIGLKPGAHGQPTDRIGHPELGNLGQSQPADIAVLEIAEGDFGLVDNGSGNRVFKTDKRIVCQMTVKNGQVVWDKNGKSRDDWSTAPPTNPAI